MRVDGVRFHVGAGMSAGPAMVKGMVVVVAATLLSAPLLCFARPGNDGAGLFALPAPRALRAAAPHGAQGGAAADPGGLAARIARALSTTVKRVVRSGVAPMFLGLHGFGVTVSGEM
ncbi:hypothetical protein [Sorangium sp. So ce385]|uniref:hypothetical protein n=1 Tax=Sorangium sp. So ce385 TaxID=3133308 RepID=UPI003F5B3261